MLRTKRFLMNGLVVACTAVFLRGVGVSFNVYITNTIGAEGIGLFGLVMSVYMLATTVASSGASLAATRLVTEELALACDKGIRKSMVICLGYTLLFGFLSGSFLFLFARPIGALWLGDERTIKSLRLLSVSMPFVALSSAMNGYFTAVRRVAKGALSQVFELLVKIAVTVLGLRIFVSRGIEYACMAVVGGGSIAEILSFLVMYGLYKLDVNRYRGQMEKEKRYLFRMLHIAVPVAVSAYLRSGLVTLEHLLIPRGLKKYGASSSASLAQYGVVHGMVMPVLLFPSAVLSAFAGLLVPELTEFQKQNKPVGINRVVSRTFGVSIPFSVGAAAIFFAFAKELGTAIYQSGDAALFIRFLAPLVVVMYTDSVTDAMLKGLNQQVYSMRYNIIDSAVSVSLIYAVLPRFGVDGYIAIIFITEILNASLSINRLLTVTGFKIPLMRTFFMPAVLAFASAYAVRFGFVVLIGYVPDSPMLLTLGITTVAVIYALLLFIIQKRQRL